MPFNFFNRQMKKESKTKKSKENQELEKDNTVNEPIEESPETGMEAPELEVSEENENEKWEARESEMNDKYLRLLSDFDNFKKRNARERLELIKTAGENVLADLIPVLDDFERGLKNMENAKDILSIQEGVKLVYQKFSKILEQKGLKAFESTGKPFDSEFHDAVTRFPAPEESQKGSVRPVVCSEKAGCDFRRCHARNNRAYERKSFLGKNNA